MNAQNAREIVGQVAKAIEEADARFGYNLTLTRLVDGESIYTLKIEGETIEVGEMDEGYAIIAARKNLRRAEAVLNALANANGGQA